MSNLCTAERVTETHPMAKLLVDKKNQLKFKNKQIYKISEQNDFRNAIIDFISSMSDNFAIDIFNEIISF